MTMLKPLIAGTALVLALQANTATAGGGYGATPHYAPYGPPPWMAPRAGMTPRHLMGPGHPMGHPPVRHAPMGHAMGRPMGHPGGHHPGHSMTQPPAEHPMQAAAAAADTARPASEESGAADASVRIQGMRFSPERIEVASGTTVEWVQQDTMPHTVALDDAVSEVLRRGDRYTMTFDTPGTFDYSCSIHPSMRGTVVVTE